MECHTRGRENHGLSPRLLAPGLISLVALASLAFFFSFRVRDDILADSRLSTGSIYIHHLEIRRTNRKREATMRPAPNLCSAPKPPYKYNPSALSPPVILT